MGDAAISQVGGATLARRTDNLAMLFQEALTVVVRLRSNRQSVGDPQSFRVQIATAFNAAGQEALRRGYAPEDVRAANFAIVAFLDESILNSHNPAFGDWVRKPLQQELFGVDMAGEIYFRNVDHLLGRGDSQELADVLEIYQLCLLLGFRGRYGLGSNAELRNTASILTERIHRIRGGSSTVLSPASTPPAEAPRATADAWIRRLLWSAVACCTLAVALFVVFKVSLNSAASELQSLNLRRPFVGSLHGNLP
jgi:type VI secretion system protein ImpK